MMAHVRSGAIPRDLSEFVARFSRLTTEEEKTASRDDLVLHNLWLARWGAMKLRRRTIAWNADPWDVFEEGILGLFVAAERWDPERGIRFSTYAANWVLQRQGRFLDHHSLVHIPTLQVRKGPEGWNEHAARAASVSSEAVIGHDGPRSLFDSCAQHEPEADFGVDEIERLREAWGLVPKRHRSVLARRELEGELLREVGEGLGVSCERVRQLQGEAVKRLRGSYRLLSPGASR